MIKFGNFIVTDNNSWLSESSSPGPTPVLPANTVRVRTNDGNPPIKGSYTSYETATLVEGTTDIYDVYKSGTSFEYLLLNSSNVTELLDANTTGITNMAFMFDSCSSLTTVPLFNTSNVTNMDHMFYGCSSLTTVPLFNTSNVTNMGYMFFNCINVGSGALALYQQASTQTTPPSNHYDTFYQCGSNTVTGAAELAQIPVSWGGTYVPVDPYNPLGLPPYTIRCKFTSGYTPVIGDSQTLIDAQDNIWDITKNSTDWWALFNGTQNYLLEVLGANTTGVTNMKKMFYNSKLLTTVALFDTSSVTDMSQMFYDCEALTTVPLFDTHNVINMAAMFDTCLALPSVPLFDTSSVTDMHQMFKDCQTLTTVPLFNTSNVTTMSYMFHRCVNVESGALALYQQASTQATPPSSHGYTFGDCGSNTITGAAELAQIPSDWK